jgi:hypothetical protein
MRIAQRFNVGGQATARVSPEGTADSLPARTRCDSAVPSGLVQTKTARPNVETLGYYLAGPSARRTGGEPAA